MNLHGITIASIIAMPLLGAEKEARMKIRAGAFADGGRVPTKFTADGADVSPELAWSEAPQGAKAFALIMDDPDAPVGTWDHWLLYDLPGDTASLAEGASAGGGGKGDAKRTAALPAGAKEGKNSWGKSAYGGPAPPPGKPHRYFFKLYALSAPLGLAAGASKTDLEHAMKGKTLAVAQWMGTYGR
ncbi:MAG: YbhB/YbcL family Raf kinase inhibitor-like protein [Myxococcota bacterium]